MSPVLLSSTSQLSDQVLASPCIAAALAVIAQQNMDDEHLRDAAALADALLGQDSTGWQQALATWAAQQGMTPDTWVPSEQPASFRVGTLRCGKHSFTSRDLDAALGDSISTLQPSWNVNLEVPHLLVVALVVHRRVTLGLLLPPFEPNRADVLPHEPRLWLQAGRERPHMRPSRAALLARLAALEAHERVLDPCGGIGTIGIEAACFAAVHVVSLDSDAAACTAAAANARAATLARCVRGHVMIVHGNALRCPFPTSSFDVAIADLPFGLRHERLDVGALMRELARVVAPGGRAVMFGSSDAAGVATACAKAVAKAAGPAVWRLVEQIPCCAGAVACAALCFDRLESPAGDSGTRNRKRRTSPAVAVGGTGAASSVPPELGAAFRDLRESPTAMSEDLAPLSTRT